MGRHDEGQDLAAVLALEFRFREPDIRRSVLFAPVAVCAFVEPVYVSVFITHRHGGSIVEVAVEFCLVLNRVAISAHDPVDCDDLQHGLQIGPIVGIAEPDLAVAHADPLSVNEHIEEILVQHGLPVALGHGLVQHVTEEGVGVSQRCAIDRNGVANHVRQGIPVFAQVCGAHMKAHHRLDHGLVHSRDHGIVIRVGDGHHIGSGPPGIHGLDLTGFIFLRDGQRFTVRSEHRAPFSAAVAACFSIYTAVALVGILRKCRIVEFHRKSLGVKAPAHDRLVVEPGAARIGDGDLCVFRTVGLDQSFRAVLGAVDADEIHYGVLPGLFRRHGACRKGRGLAERGLLAAGAEGKDERQHDE